MFLFFKLSSLKIKRFVVTHYFPVVLGIVELVHLDEEGNVAGLEGREHPGYVWNVNVAHSKFNLFWPHKQVVDMGGIFILNLTKKIFLKLNFN